ncbi:hypothetical protein ES703_36642 [subsurface metagenome]
MLYKELVLPLVKSLPAVRIASDLPGAARRSQALVAESIRPRRLRSRAVAELPPAGMAATELLAMVSAATPQELAVRQRYQVAAEEAVRGLHRSEEITRRLQEEEERQQRKYDEAASASSNSEQQRRLERRRDQDTCAEAYRRFMDHCLAPGVKPYYDSSE